eukprot:1316323-Prorocentrum_lima.AAC.1
MTSSLVGSEMCIRDRSTENALGPGPQNPRPTQHGGCEPPTDEWCANCLLYTSDAADDMQV